MQTTLVLATSP